MAEFTLVGYVADPVGNESRLMEAAPVIRQADALFTAPGLDWDSRSLIRIPDEEQNFITPVESRRIHEGDTVWLAGREYHAAVNRDAEARLNTWGMKNWPEGPGRTRWQTGSRADFRRFVIMVSNHFERQLHLHLFDRLEKDTDSAKSVFVVYRSLPAPATKERALNIGLYYFETADERAYNIAVDNAVRGRLFRSRRAYEKALRQLRGRLRVSRLSDVRRPRGWTAEQTLAWIALTNRRAEIQNVERRRVEIRLLAEPYTQRQALQQVALHAAIQRANTPSELRREPSGR